jgi:hypothetical protein
LTKVLVGRIIDAFLTFCSPFYRGEKECCNLENLVNLDKLPKPYGFKISVFPIKIAKASSGWVQAVAIFED